MRIVDIRPFIQEIKCVDYGLEIFTRLENGHTVRIEEILRLLFKEEEDVHIVRVNRSGLCIQFGEILKTPMEI